MRDDDDGDYDDDEKMMVMAMTVVMMVMVMPPDRLHAAKQALEGNSQRPVRKTTDEECGCREKCEHLGE